MKKYILSLSAFLVLTFTTYAFSAKDIDTYTLENGLRVFLLEDPSSATVSMELNIYAGYSSQTPDTTGYQELYASLMGLDITDEFTYTQRSFAPDCLEEVIEDITSYFKPLNVTDEDLKTHYDRLYKEMSEFSKSTAHLINSSIETVINPSYPWKSKAGFYSEAFYTKSLPKVRTVLKNVGQTLYTPSNASLFISGNINKDKTAALLTKAFNQFASSARYVKRQAKADVKAEGRRFVIMDDELSDEMTQLAVEYTDVNRELSQFAGEVLNNDSFTLKQRLSSKEELNISSPQYINIAASHKKSSSRLIIQAILQNTKASPASQINTFIDIVKNGEITDDNEAEYTRYSLSNDFMQTVSDSRALMHQLSTYVITSDDADSTQAFFDRIERTKSFTANDISSLVQDNEPYVFALVNTKMYNRYITTFKKAGFIPLTKKNGSWYTKKEYKDFLAQKEESVSEEIDFDAADKYIKANKDDFTCFTLKNGIGVTVKNTDYTEYATVNIIIKGGELLFMNSKSGLALILTDSIAANIQNAVKFPCSVKSSTTSSYSQITITCPSIYLNQAVMAAGWTLIYSDITPAVADSVAYDERTQWRIKSGSAEFQLLCEAVKILYKEGDYKTLFNPAQDKPVEMDFSQIISAYPLLLDSSRYSICINGNIDDTEKLKKSLDMSFGILDTIKASESKDRTVPKPVFKNTIKKVSVKHTFLTDIPKEKAGPRPVLLIPTVNFNDPCLYCFESPDAGTTDSALFNALIYELKERLEAKLTKEQKVRFDCADSTLPFARIYISHLESIQKTENIYRTTVRELIDDLKNASVSRDEQGKTLIKRLENLWIMNTLTETPSSQGMGDLMVKGLIKGRPDLYLEKYNVIHNAKADDYYIVAAFYLDNNPLIKLYSKDTKR